MNRIKLFCFPHAGASASCFINWEEELESIVKLMPVELAGRGMRYESPLYNCMDEVLSDMITQIGDIFSCPFAFYGHSSGAAIAYTLADRLETFYGTKPIHIFLSSLCPPKYLSDSDILLSHLSKDELKVRLLQMGGTTEEFFEEEEMVDFFIPAMLSDIKILEEYSINKDKCINSDLSILYGYSDDRVKHMNEWAQYTNGTCHICQYKGGHFFNQEYENEAEILQYILKTLQYYMNH